MKKLAVVFVTATLLLNAIAPALTYAATSSKGLRAALTFNF